MPSIRFPVLFWKDGGGHFGACAVHEPQESAAIGSTRSDVLDQVKDFFIHVHRKEPWRETPQLHDAALVHLKIPVRPAYLAPKKSPAGRHRRQSFAAAPISLPVACVHGKSPAGLAFAAVPLLNIFFQYHEHENLKETITHYVRQALHEMPLEQLLRLLPPPHVELDELIVRLETPRAPLRDSPWKTLDAVADPISDRAFKTGLMRPWQRDQQLAALAEFLAKEKTSAILVGPPGVGKSALLVEAVRHAQRAGGDADAQPNPAARPSADADTDAELPAEPPRPPRFWLTSGARLIAGMRYLGQWQERCEALIAELAALHGTLCVERLLELVTTGGRDPAAGIGAFLIPYLRRGELRLIAEATPEELDACRRLLPDLVDACRQFIIEPLDATQSVAALEQVAKVRAQGTRIVLDPAALPQIHRLFSRFQPYAPMPGPAVAFLGELFDHAAAKKIPRLDAPLALQQFTRRTGLPDWLLRDDLPLRRQEILSALQKQIIGQDDPCSAAADVILTFKAGLNDPARPLGVLLFAGPTGVGKTELARAFAAFLFGHGERKDRLVRLDMSEYAGPGAAERLLGSPDGDPGPLISPIRRQPFNILLLDEIEKAAPEVFDLLLALFDEGRLTDRFGRLTTFRSAIVIMTSNLGAASTEPFGLSPVAARTHASEIAAHFRPEFFNRIDQIVTFAPLGQDSMRRIAENELTALARREGLAMRKLKLQWTPALLDHLVAAGFDKRYGARPLQRVIETLIAVPLAKHLAALRTPPLANTILFLDLDPHRNLRLTALPPRR